MNEKFKTFLEISKPPLIVAIIAVLLYVVDGFIAYGLDLGGRFMWVAFAAWTISFGKGHFDKIRMFIGNIVGFTIAVGMMALSSVNSPGVMGVTIMGVLAIFLFNFIAMYFPHFKKLWLCSITGIFMGIFLTFTGLGIGLRPLTGAANTFTVLGVILLYSVLGYICAFFSVYFINKWKKKEPAQITSSEDEQEDK